MSFITQPITIQSIFGTKRTLGPITAQVVLSEETTDVLTITKQPVQTGAPITDHSYKEPTSLVMRILQQDQDLLGSFLSTFSGNGLAAIYEQFLELQSSRTPFDVVTPKRLYKNMLIASLRQNTDKQTENCLSFEVGLQEVILVSIGVSQVSPLNQRNRKVTQQTQKLGRKSAALTGAQAVGINASGYSLQ